VQLDLLRDERSHFGELARGSEVLQQMLERGQQLLPRVAPDLDGSA
jgi:hypothetical protein